MVALMSELLGVLSQALSLALLLLAILAFAFRKWLGALIDSRFKRKLAVELEDLKHGFATEVELQRARLTKDIETHKRQLDASAKIATRIQDKRIDTYETYYVEYGRALVQLHSLYHLYMSDPPIDPNFLESTRMDCLRLVRTAEDKMSICALYSDPDLTIRMADLYRNLISYITSGARNWEILNTLTGEQAQIGAEMRFRLTGSALEPDA